MGENRQVVVCRELTKIHQEFKRGLPLELAKWYSDNPPKGEIVMLIEGKDEKGGRSENGEV